MIHIGLICYMSDTQNVFSGVPRQKSQPRTFYQIYELENNILEYRMQTLQTFKIQLSN
jgi:hypothetical protein